MRATHRLLLFVLLTFAAIFRYNFFIMKMAVVKIAGKQYKVKEGDVLKVDRCDGQIDDVLLYADGRSIKIGQPSLSNVKVDTEVLEHTKDKKILVMRFKAKSRYRRKKGHRQPITRLKIKKITKK